MTRSMLHRCLLFLMAISLSQTSLAQNANPLDFFEPFIGKTWSVAGTWGDGSVFMQEVTMEWGLNKTIIRASTKGFINAERTEIGDRSFGVRKYNRETEEIEFWEFDTFGGVTTGTVKVDGDDFYYIYQYADQTFADIWEYVDDQTYRFRVVQYDNGEIGSMYLNTEYRLKQ